jgi:dTDP-4-dehydrorhamnose reductase
LGASGFLGSGLFEHLRERHDVIGTALYSQRPGLLRLDLRDARATAEMLRRGFDLVIHAAGLVDLAVAECDPELAWAVNARSARTVAASTRARVVYISTDNVFAGTSVSYVESDVPEPINVYGRTKLYAERVFTAVGEHTVLRLPLLVGGGPRDKFLARFAGPRTRAQTDIVTNPVYLPDLFADLDRLWHLRGVVHYGGATALSRYELMLAVQRSLRLDTEVIPMAGTDVAPGRLRPKRLVLRSNRHACAGRGLDEMLADLAHIALKTGDR